MEYHRTENRAIERKIIKHIISIINNILNFEKRVLNSINNSIFSNSLKYETKETRYRLFL